MKRAYSNFTFAVTIVAACVAAPLTASAQQPAAPTTTPPAAYLDQAGKALDAVPKSVQHDASKPLDDLRKHFQELSKQYGEQHDSVGPPLTRQNPDEPEPATWRTSFADVERDLVALIGGGSSLGEPSATGQQVPASTAQGSAAAIGLTGSVTNPPLTTGTTGTSGSPGTTAPAGQAPVTGTPPGTAAMPATGAGVAVPGTPTNTNAAAPANAGSPNVPTNAGSGTVPTNTGLSTVPTVAAPAASSGMLADAGALAATKVSLVGVRDLDPKVRSQLEQVRLQLELFLASTLGR